MRSLRTSLLLAAAFLLPTSFATHIDLPRRYAAHLPNLLARAPNATSGLDNSNGGYHINITLGGKQFSVLLDSGR